MDANETRYRTLVTQNDWEVQARSENQQLKWSDKVRGLTLQPLLFEFKPAEQAVMPPDEPGRGGAFDAYGNLYSLAPGRLAIRVRSAGSGEVSPFWPTGAATEGGVGAIEGLQRGTRGATTGNGEWGFHPDLESVPPPDVSLDALVVTVRHHLVAASRQAGGLLIFDLHGAGPPLFQPWAEMRSWPEGQGVTSMVALDDGGVAVLAGSTIYRLGASLKPLVPVKPAPFFAPLRPASPPPESQVQRSTTEPCKLDLSGALGQGAEATALALSGARLIMLSESPLGAGNVSLRVLGLDGVVVPVSASGVTNGFVELNELIEHAGGTRPLLAAHAVAVHVDPETSDGFSIFVIAKAGDQAFRFVGTFTGKVFELTLKHEYWPMRRYDSLGLAVLPSGTQLHGYPLARLFYASEGRWAPLLQLARPRFELEGKLLTPVWDGGVDGCEWHRFMLDMSLPPGTSVTVETRTADGPDGKSIEREPFLPEPALIQSARGSEQAWQDASELDRRQGIATWETLLQSAKHRWFQARLTIRGDGQHSPVLRALRVWYPRFSYARNYLPPIYREDAISADFLDRFLALFEGDFTRWEDRIAAAELLCDARTAPGQTLEWLATWIGLSFDAADTDLARRRLLIRYAVRSYSRRGSVLGLLLASTLAWEPNIKEEWLSDPITLTLRQRGVRLQEFFSRVNALPKTAWSPAEGRSQLVCRLSEQRAELATDIEGANSLLGTSPQRSKRLLQVLGFIPRAAAEEDGLWRAWQTWSPEPVALPTDEPTSTAASADFAAYLKESQPCAPLRQRWQDFLSRRHRRISALNAEWGAAWRGFERIPSPIAIPGAPAALLDWHRFEAQVLRAQPHAHRFRVVLPVPTGTFDVDDLVRRRTSVLRVIEREKPAHTVAEVRFGFELFSVGEARLGLDTQLEHGLARRPELKLLSRAVLGRTELGTARLNSTRPQAPPDRVGLDRGEPFKSPTA